MLSYRAAFRIGEAEGRRQERLRCNRALRSIIQRGLRARGIRLSQAQRFILRFSNFEELETIIVGLDENRSLRSVFSS